LQAAFENNKSQLILEGANTQFNQYGFRKTSLEDIARAVGISRTSLYSYFPNKDAIFRAVSQEVHERALAEAKHVLNGKEDIELRVEAALLARHAPFHEMQATSPHGLELHDEYSRLCGDIVTDSQTRFEAMLVGAIKRAARSGSIDLKRAGVSSAEIASTLNLASAGQKRGAKNSVEFAIRINCLVRIAFAGLSA
jgi:AcrR family transcriptional regulator